MRWLQAKEGEVEFPPLAHSPLTVNQHSPSLPTSSDRSLDSYGECKPSQRILGRSQKGFPRGSGEGRITLDMGDLRWQRSGRYVSREFGTA